MAGRTLQSLAQRKSTPDGSTPLVHISAAPLRLLRTSTAHETHNAVLPQPWLGTTLIRSPIMFFMIFEDFPGLSLPEESSNSSRGHSHSSGSCRDC